MSKNLLVLAASRYQLDVIRGARRLGHRVITLDNCPGNPGHREADGSFNVDTTDMEAVLEIARKEKIDGVIAACTDVAVPTAAFLSENLGLQGPRLESARITCSKTLFRTFLRKHEFPVPESHKIDPGYQPHPGIFENGPWIMKPDDSSGSKGIFIVRSLSEYRERLPQTLGFSPGRTGILERFIAGVQGTCEGVLRHGEIALACITDRLTAEPPFVATRGHCIPTTLPLPMQDRLMETLSRMWRLLSVSDGPFDCDFVAAADGIYLLEASPRIGGNCIASLLRLALDFDIVDHSIGVALGEDPRPPAQAGARPAAILILGVPGSGRLVYDRDGADSLRSESWVRQLSFDVDYGAPVQPFINGRHRIGEALVLGGDRTDVDANVAELYRRLKLGVGEEAFPAGAKAIRKSL